MSKSQTQKYHPGLVTLHWILAALIGASLIMGFFRLDPIPESNPAKIDALRAHMVMGILILVLMIARTLLRLRKPKPDEPDSGYTLLNRIARPVHWIIYGVIFALIGSGVAMSVMAGLPPIVFGGSGDPLPTSFDDLAPRAAHGFLALVLSGLVALHLAAVIYHEAVRGTDLLARMWYKSDDF